MACNGCTDRTAELARRHAGVVVLSENAGSHEDLGEWTLTINPFDIEGTAEALYQAVTMELDERRRRCAAITSYVREHDVAKWSTDQLDDLDRLCGPAAAE